MKTVQLAVLSCSMLIGANSVAGQDITVKIDNLTNGSYFTPWMDVPSAITAEFVLGKWLLDKSLQLEINYWGQNSLSGDDIRAYNAPQPTNQVNMHRVGLFAHYFFKSVPGLGIVAYHNRVIHGRNAPEFKTIGTGVTYFFNYRKK